MMVDFNAAFERVIGIEGGYVNDPADPGGETKYGISKRAYPGEDIKSLTLDRAKTLYQRDYWDRCHCGDLPGPLNLYVFDSAVNQGVDAAIKILQRTLGVAQDGVIGPKTLAVAAQTSGETAALYLADRALRYADSNNFDKYGRGWLKRLFIVAIEV